MPPDRDEATLLAWQRRFAAALHEPGRGGLDPTSSLVATQREEAHVRFGVYRNNSRQARRGALALTYPVLQRRVGDDYFRQLAHEYRLAHPSHSGDLHDGGAAFPAWLQARLAGTDYAWLADLARLEWAVEEAGAAAALAPVPLTTLATVPATALDDTTLQFQPSLRLVSSAFPVWSVWQANQDGAPAAPLDERRAEHCACACTADRVVVYRLAAADYAVLEALSRGATFAAALDAARSDAAGLARVLDWAFAEGLVVAVNPSARA
jgi:Uncharacterized protein conserved in bacteria (DUF2063).